nr:MAG TPA: hypothetical protein [Caudoviricetes sp.]
MVALLLSIVVATPSIIFYLFKPLGGSKPQPKPANITFLFRVAASTTTSTIIDTIRFTLLRGELVLTYKYYNTKY